jgi:plasmid stabilization system protein ParE
VPGEQAWVHPAAIVEARAARDWYRVRNAEAAEVFMAELDLAIERIEETPRQWPAYFGETRRYLLRRFPFFVVFREGADRVEIVAVVHARRRPGYWLGR